MIAGLLASLVVAGQPRFAAFTLVYLAAAGLCLAGAVLVTIKIRPDDIPDGHRVSAEECLAGTACLGRGLTRWPRLRRPIGMTGWLGL